jgi:hypothetical protein
VILKWIKTIKEEYKTMKKQFLSLIFIISLVIMNTSSFVQAEERQPSNETCLNQSVVKLREEMQELWIEHAWWTRSVMVSKLANLEDQNELLNRLLQNQVDIGNLIKPYYEDEAGNKLTELLKEPIVIAGEIIDAAKKGDQKNVDKLNKDWVRNADEIVAFLTSANPNWSKKELTDMFYTHLKFIKDEVTHRLKKEWAADIQTADLNETHLLHMSNILTDGIVKQFPEKFK